MIKLGATTQHSSKEGTLKVQPRLNFYLLFGDSMDYFFIQFLKSSAQLNRNNGLVI